MAGNKLYICLETKTRGKRKNYFIFCQIERLDYAATNSCDSQEDMCGYFADFECGIFSLSVSDKLSFNVYTFEFSIIGTESDGTLKVNFNLLTHYRIKLDRLPLTANNILGIVGCFASSPNHRAIKSADEAINNYMSSHG